MNLPNKNISNGVKILYIITQADGGGAQKYVLTLAKYFDGTIAAGNEATKLFDEAKKLDVNTIQLHHLKREISPYHDLLATFEIRQLVKSENFDIVHLNSTKAGILGSFACIGLKPKVVFTAHGFRFLEPLPTASKNFYLALEKIASTYRDFIITVSDFDKKAALANKIIDKNKIQTVYNGIENIKFLDKNSVREELNLPLDKKIWVTTANDYPTKNLDAFATFRPVSGTMLAVIGNAPNRNSTQNIKFLGPKQQAAKYLKGFDGVIIPSLKEGLPFVALEAMQAGKPIIASKVGGIPEALGDAAELIDPDEFKNLNKYIEIDFLQENKSAELSKKALERSKLFTEEKMLVETQEIYKRLLS